MNETANRLPPTFLHSWTHARTTTRNNTNNTTRPGATGSTAPSKRMAPLPQGREHPRADDVSHVERSDPRASVAQHGTLVSTTPRSSMLRTSTVATVGRRSPQQSARARHCGRIHDPDHDPGAALRRAEARATRKADLMKIQSDAAEPEGSPQSLRRGSPRARSFRHRSPRQVAHSRTALRGDGKCSCTSSTTSAFGSSSTGSRFRSGPTERAQTSGAVGPGAYEQHDRSIRSGTSDCGQNRGATRFTYGQAPPELQHIPSAAQMAYEAKGLHFIDLVHSRPEGWLRADLNRWMLAADNRVHYMQQRQMQELGRQQVDLEEQLYRERGKAAAAATADQRRLKAEQVKELQRRRAEDSAQMKADAGARAQKLQAKASAWLDHARECAHEARDLGKSMRRARSDVELARARSAETLRAERKQTEQTAHEQREERERAVRAAHDATRAAGRHSPPLIGPAGSPNPQSAAFQALTTEEKQAVDHAMASATAARERAKERARESQRREQERKVADAARYERPSGLRWRDAGPAKPTSGVELSHEDLAAALLETTEFSESEWRSFKVKDLRAHHFIRVRNTYFQPMPRQHKNLTQIVQEERHLRLAAQREKALMEAEEAAAAAAAAAAAEAEAREEADRVAAVEAAQREAETIAEAEAAQQARKATARRRKKGEQKLLPLTDGGYPKATNESAQTASPTPAPAQGLVAAPAAPSTTPLATAPAAKRAASPVAAALVGENGDAKCDPSPEGSLVNPMEIVRPIPVPDKPPSTPSGSESRAGRPGASDESAR
jgi:hypothetical protein